MRLRSITIALTWRGRCAWGQFKWWRLRDVAVAAADVVCRPVQERKVAKRRGAAFVLRGGREDGIHRLLVREDVPHPVAADRDERAVDDVNLDRVAMRDGLNVPRKVEVIVLTDGVVVDELEHEQRRWQHTGVYHAERVAGHVQLLEVR